MQTQQPHSVNARCSPHHATVGIRQTFDKNSAAAYRSSGGEHSSPPPARPSYRHHSRCGVSAPTGPCQKLGFEGWPGLPSPQPDTGFFITPPGNLLPRSPIQRCHRPPARRAAPGRQFGQPPRPPSLHRWRQRRDANEHRSNALPSWARADGTPNARIVCASEGHRGFLRRSPPRPPERANRTGSSAR